MNSLHSILSTQTQAGIGSAMIIFSTLALPSLTHAMGKPAGNGKDIPVDITFDPNHIQTGEPNGILADSGSYSDSNTISAFVGRNSGIWLEFSEVGRNLTIDLSSPLGAAASVPVDLVTDVVGPDDVTILSTESDGICDYCYHDPVSASPLRPQPPSVLQATVVRFEIAAGEDLDDMDASGSCVLETNARLWFTDASGNKWRLNWGPRQLPGGKVPNPRCYPIRLTRVNQGGGNYWFFESTGDHFATLYRLENPQAGNYFEYFGQFKIPYSGFVVAQNYDPNLSGTVCTVTIQNAGAGLVPSQVTLTHDAGTNVLTATAIDQCDEFSSAPSSFDWLVDGTLVAQGVGNTFDLKDYPGANAVTVFGVHPDWLVKLPDLLTITRGDVEGSASFSQGAGGGNAMIAPLSWSFPRGGKDVQVVISIVEPVSGSPISGIDITATLDGPGGTSIPISGTTGSTGELTHKEQNASDGEWCINNLNVTDPSGSFAWDGASPVPNCTTK